jgi:hypothetical protein
MIVAYHDKVVERFQKTMLRHSCYKIFAKVSSAIALDNRIPESSLRILEANGAVLSVAFTISANNFTMFIGIVQEFHHIIICQECTKSNPCGINSIK